MTLLLNCVIQVTVILSIALTSLPLLRKKSAALRHIVQLLVSRRADVNARVWVEANPGRPNGEWRTPLSVARREGHQDIVQFLLSVGARE